MPRTAIVGTTIFLGVMAATQPAAQNSLPIEKIKLAPGFKLSMYASGVQDARSMALAPSGTLFVGTRRAGNVYAIVDRNKDYAADEVVVLARGLKMPNGVAFRDGSLYVAEVNRVLRFDDIEKQLKSPPQPVSVSNAFPSDEHHGWKFIRFGPDGRLYVPVGAPCNICLRDDPKYASITRMKADGSGLEVFANGVRNTVGFDWHPTSGELWFTENGRDMIGDDTPPDELNRAARTGQHFGFPFCHGDDIADPEFGSKRKCSEFVPPAAKLGPHVAAIGMRFYTGKMFPEEYRNQIFMAEHGSWNRSQPLGYRIMLARLSGERVTSYEVFAEGWLQGIAKQDPQRQRTVGDAWGRPVDVEVMPDGSMLVSDDEAGAIYRVTYQKP